MYFCNIENFTNGEINERSFSNPHPWSGTICSRSLAPWTILSISTNDDEQSSPNFLTHDLSLRWRHNGHHGVSNHQHHQCLLNRLFRRRSKITSKLRVTGLCAGNSPVTGEFLQRGKCFHLMTSSWIVALLAVYDILIPSQFDRLSGPNLHAYNYW